MIMHPWNVTCQQAIQIQNELRDKVIKEDIYKEIQYVAGIDVGFERNYKITIAAIAILSFPDLKLTEYVKEKIPTQFPYIPGLLSFREVPAILHAFEKLRLKPDMLLCDGQGMAHPRRLGLACHIGILTDLPSIGVAKKRLCGRHEEIPDKKGSWVHLYDDDEIIGAVLRSRTGVKPIYISVGHKICLESAINIVKQCITKYRLPETTRHAHKLASRV